MGATSRITRFLPAAAPVTTPTAQFGGQPTWLAEPAWPVSEGWGTPMRFVCQVPLDGDRLSYGRQGRFLVQDS